MTVETYNTKKYPEPKLFKIYKIFNHIASDSFMLEDKNPHYSQLWLSLD